MSFLIPQRVLSDLEEGYEKSMLNRTKPFLQLIVSKTPKVYNFFSKENAFLFAIYCNLLQFIAIYCDNIIWENTRKQHYFGFTYEKFTFSFFSLTLNSFAALQKHLNKGKQEVKLEKESSSDEIKSKISKGLPFCRGWLRFRSDLMKKFWWTIPC